MGQQKVLKNRKKSIAKEIFKRDNRAMKAKSVYQPSILGENIRHYREEAERTQKWLAGKIGVAPRIISRIETGLTRTMFVEQAVDIARALGVTVEDLVTNRETDMGRE